MINKYNLNGFEFERQGLSEDDMFAWSFDGETAYLTEDQLTTLKSIPLPSEEEKEELDWVDVICQDCHKIWRVNHVKDNCTVTMRYQYESSPKKPETEKWIGEFAPNLGHDPNNPFPLKPHRPETEPIEMPKMDENVTNNVVFGEYGMSPPITQFSDEVEDWMESITKAVNELRK